MMSGNIEVGGALGVVAIFGLLWSGSSIFGAISRAVNRAGDVQKNRPLLISKPPHLLMALSVGVMFLLSLGAAGLVRTARAYAHPGLAGPWRQKRGLASYSNLLLLDGKEIE